MAEINQFGSFRGGRAGDAKLCAHFESMLADAIDGTLTSEDQAAFDLHMVGCESCSGMLADAKRGAAWMEMLRPHRPEPSAELVERILAQTSGLRPLAGADGVEQDAGDTVVLPQVAGMGSASGAGLAGSMGKVLPFHVRVTKRMHLRAIGHTLLQPRLAMTAAMAFFSIALTLNLTGVKLNQLKMSDLRPASLKRSFYAANAHVVRYYDNLRVVYELESRVHDLQRSSDDDAPAPTTQQNGSPAGTKSADPGDKNKKDEPDRSQQRVRPGTSRRENGSSNSRFVAVSDRVRAASVPSKSFAVLSPSVICHRKEGGLV